jgi:hypothetical protein
MYRAAWIKEAGERYLKVIQDDRPLFLGELQVAKEELSELFRGIRQCHSIDQCDETRASLAVAAVHAAVQASDEDNSYFAVFFRQLREVGKGGAAELLVWTRDSTFSRRAISRRSNAMGHLSTFDRS